MVGPVVVKPEMPYSRAMASSTAISVDEYLQSVYRPDCDYVDGEIIERNVGEFQHSMIQGILIRMLYECARRLPIRVVPELRMRVSRTRFRIPDICVMLKQQRPEPVLTTPPFLCIEILSPEDRMSRVIERVREYLKFGVHHVWVVDPENRTAYSYTKGREVNDRLMTANPEISISLGDLFTELDEASKSDE
jgi:Uma2 family endonuclease